MGIAFSVVTLCFCSFADPPVEGDLASLNLIKDAQIANVNRYPHGELRGVVEYATARDATPVGRMEVHLRWDRDKVRCWSKFTKLDVKLASENNQPDPTLEIDAIVDSQRIIQHYPRSLTMRVEPLGLIGPYPGTVSLLPAKSWYGTGRPWFEFFGPHPNFPQQKVIRYIVRKIDDDRIELIREDQQNGRLRIVSSLKDDGNVVEKTGSHPASKQSTRDSYTWSRDEKGRCFLERSETELTAFSKRHNRVTVDFRKYQTIAFDPDYQPGPDIFEMTSLNPKPGTRLEDKIEKKTRTIGERTVASVADRLEPLIIEMKSRGFSKPDR